MILFVSRNPPNASGPGGSQRAMHLLRAVARHGPVDFLMLYRDEDTESVTDPLDAVRPLVSTCERLEIAEWAAPLRRWPQLSWRYAQIAEAVSLQSVDVPRFSRATLADIGKRLQRRRYQLVFAARQSSARIVDGLIGQGLLQADRKVVDFDDRLLAFKQREFLIKAPTEGRLRRTLQRREMRLLRRAERLTTARWDAVSLANELDAQSLRDETGRPVHVVPNVVSRPLLPWIANDVPSLLFVGHLSYDPNVHGLTRFLREIWPRIKQWIPNIRLDVVGMRPNPDLVRLINASGAALHANVPSVEPFYAACDIVVAPIWEGGGTRIKILEAMAYGRPVVSTSVGAEGLGVEPGVTAMIADTDDGFSGAVVGLARNPARRQAIIAAARDHQTKRFSTDAVDEAVRRMVQGDGTER